MRSASAILEPSKRSAVAILMALCTAGEVPDIWQNDLRFYCVEAMVILNRIGGNSNINYILNY